MQNQPPAAASSVTPFRIAVPEEDIIDLRHRLARTRWPEKETVGDWSQGVPLEEMKKLVAYWQHQYDWRRCEAALNAFPQFKAMLNGIGIHFLHIRSSNENALPLILTHGWPGSIIEFLKVIGPLSEPQNFGGNAEDAFHLVIPALPGYGFSDKPGSAGWGVAKIAAAWHDLMQTLGYHEYVAQGGDWGAAVTRALALQQPEGLQAVHLNLPVVLPPPPYENLDAGQTAMLESMAYYQQHESGYSTQQATRPQTLGYGLADSPVGQAAWIFEKFKAWTDCQDNPLNILSYDEILDNIMLYWLPNCATSSARLYWESFGGGFIAQTVPVPCGYSIFPKELYKAPRSWAEQCTPRLIHWNELDRGGHFAAFEQPELFTKELRDCFRAMR